MEVVQASSAVVSKLLHTTQAWTAAAYHSRPLPWPVYQSLPVAGLGVLDTQAALYTLRTSLDTDEVCTMIIMICSWSLPIPRGLLEGNCTS